MPINRPLAPQSGGFHRALQGTLLCPVTGYCEWDAGRGTQRATNKALEANTRATIIQFQHLVVQVESLGCR